MIPNKVTAFLPCRKGSQRIPLKNTKPFSENGESLISIKINQLLQVECVEKVILSTDDPVVKEIGLSKNNSKIQIDDRPKDLASSNTSTDELISYVSTIIDSSHILWTHVTSPFITSNIYSVAIKKYFQILELGKFDSLMTVTKLRKFLWDDSGPINYSRNVEKWPRTQTINPIYEINSGIFLSHSDIYKQVGDRIGNKPYFFDLEELDAFDIDWEYDFLVGQLLDKIIK